jgi:hypothetical protein
MCMSKAQKGKKKGEIEEKEKRVERMRGRDD